MSDSISREAVLTCLCNRHCATDPAECLFKITHSGPPGCSTAYDVLKIPSTEVRPVVYGEWINKRHGIGWCSAECSICGNHVGGRAIDTGFGFDYTFPKLCDNCGADMTGGADS